MLKLDSCEYIFFLSASRSEKVKLLAEVERLKDELSELSRSKDAEMGAERAKERAERAAMEAAMAELHAQNKVREVV